MEEIIKEFRLEDVLLNNLSFFKFDIANQIGRNYQRVQAIGNLKEPRAHEDCFEWVYLLKEA